MYLSIAHSTCTVYVCNMYVKHNHGLGTFKYIYMYKCASALSYILLRVYLQIMIIK